MIIGAVLHIDGHGFYTFLELYLHDLLDLLPLFITLFSTTYYLQCYINKGLVLKELAIRNEQQQ